MRQNAPCEGRCGRDHARLLASQGRHGDTLVAHISPLEAAILRLLGGSGTINPKTGLPEFWGLGGGVSSGGHGDAGDGTGGAASRGGGSGSGKDDSSGASYQGGGTTTSTSRSTGLGNAYARVAAGLGLNGQPAPAPTTKWGNENAYIGDKYQKAIKGTDASGIVGFIAKVLGFTPAAPVGWGLDIANSMGAFDDIGGMSVAEQRDRAYGNVGGSGGGGVSRGNGGRGDSGGLPGNHASIAQRAQQANAGGGLLPAPNSQPASTSTPITSDLPVGLLQYLAQNPGLLQGLATQSRFGAGSVAPINYMRPYP